MDSDEVRQLLLDVPAEFTIIDIEPMPESLELPPPPLKNPPRYPVLRFAGGAWRWEYTADPMVRLYHRHQEDGTWALLSPPVDPESIHRDVAPQERKVSKRPQDASRSSVLFAENDS